LTRWWTCNVCEEKVGYAMAHYVEFGTCNPNFDELEPDTSFGICPDCFKKLFLIGFATKNGIKAEWKKQPQVTKQEKCKP